MLTKSKWVAPAVHDMTDELVSRATGARIGLYRESAIAIESEAKDPWIWL